MANELKFGNKVVFLGGLPLTLPVAASDPGSAANGDLYYNSGSDRVRVYAAGVWTDLATGGSAANQALSNLSAVAINTSLIPGIDNSINLGSAAASWAIANIHVLNDSAGDASVHPYNRQLSDGTLSQLEWSASGIGFPQLTASTVPYLSAGKFLTSSAVTPTELGYLSGVTSAIQTQLSDQATDIADLVTLTGVAANSVNLGTFTGSIISNNITIKAALQELETAIEALPDPLVYQGTWDASTNTPTLANTDTGVAGYLYQVNVAGTVDFGAGNISFEVGDKVVNNGTIWEKWDMTDAVASVNGQTGIVVLDTGDISENGNLYFTDERAQDAVGAMVANSSKVSLTYVDGTPSLTADIIAGSLVNADINASAAIALTKLAALNNDIVPVTNGSGFLTSSAVTATELGYLSGVTSAIQTQLNGKASTALSNLASVAINTSLISDTDNTDDLGSDSIEWKDVWAYSIKHNSAGTPTLAIQTTGNNGSLNLIAHGTGNLDLQATKLRRSENGASSNYMEEQYLDALTLNANVSSATAISSLTFAFASFTGVVVEYMIKEATSGKVRIGKLMVSTDGSVVSASDQFSETAVLGSALGLSLDAAINGSNVEIRYNNTHATNACTVRCLVTRIRA